MLLALEATFAYVGDSRFSRHVQRHGCWYVHRRGECLDGCSRDSYGALFANASIDSSAVKRMFDSL